MAQMIKLVFSNYKYVLLASAIFVSMMIGLLILSEYIFLEPYFISHLPSGSEFGFVGEFQEVVAQTRLVHTQIYDAVDLPDSMGEKESVVAVKFTEADGVTLAATTIEFASKEDREVALSTGMTEGMEMSYKQLDEVLAE